MKIEKLKMEDWLADYQFVKYNLAESGFRDLTIGELLSLCDEDPGKLQHISLMNPDTHGSAGLRREILECYESAVIENILVTVGVTEALFAFFNVILEPGDEVIVENPEFQTLYELPQALGCQIKYLNLSKEGGYLPDADSIGELITPKTRLIIINTPHNPTGSVLDPDEILKIGKIAQEKDIYLLFDEHYKFLPLETGTRQLTSGFDICREHHHKVAAVGSVTKCFGLNGLRVGWLLAAPRIIEECREFKHYLTHVTPPICDYLTETALHHKETLIAHVKQIIMRNLDQLNSFMERNRDRFDYTPPRGGLVCFPRLKNDRDSNLFCKQLLDNHNVSLLPGEAFGKSSHFRINIGVETDIFASALQLIEKQQY